MTIFNFRLGLVGLAIGGVAFGLPVHAQGKATVSAAQAARGKTVYDNVCVSCHESLEYTGPDFRDKWNGRPIFDLYDLMRTTMPDDAPGTLTAQQYIDVVTYMMKLNGVAAGKADMPTAADSLKKLKMDIPGKLTLRVAPRSQR